MCLSRIGLFPGECIINFDLDANPVVYPPRKIPLALHAHLKKELEKSDIVTKVTEPTDWVNALVVVAIKRPPLS